jgi:hypothetical protein
MPIVLRRTVQEPRYHESRLRRPRDIVPAQESRQRIDSACRPMRTGLPQAVQAGLGGGRREGDGLTRRGG